ncbi:hypothetical protein GCM10022630_21760 [Thermobifida alba]|uniref:hypothetical protein n=1 Tax=Thermobifida alba TaxID=53522 RepID=UPI0031ED6C65
MPHPVARLVRWLSQVFGPHRPGRHARGRLPLPVPTPPNASRPPSSAPAPQEPAHRLDADEVALVRPYLVHHERALAARRCRSARVSGPGGLQPSEPVSVPGQPGEFDELARLLRELLAA